MNELQLFNLDEFKAFTSKAMITASYADYSDRFDIWVQYFSEPLYCELFRFFSFHSESCTISIKFLYLYDSSSILRLLSEWFKHSASSIEDFEFRGLKPYNLIFEFPQFIFKSENVRQEEFFKYNLPNLQLFLEYVFNYQQLYLSVLKSEECPLSSTLTSSSSNEDEMADKNGGDEEAEKEKDEGFTGTYKLYFFSEIEVFSRKSPRMYRVGFTNYSEHYLLLLGKFISEFELEKYVDILEVGRWYDIKVKSSGGLSSRATSLSNYDGVLVGCERNEEYLKDEFADRCNRKAFPLGVCTKYSSFDGLFQYEDWARLTSSIGYRVLPISDFNNVHAFPEVEEISREYGLQPIYGVEMEVISERLEVIHNLEAFEKNSEIVYSIFDLETTGLHPLFDDIFEIYILKFRKGIVIDIYHSYMQFKGEIKREIMDLTRITREKLDSMGRDRKEVLEEVREFTKNTILVAHNGMEFDLPFLNSQYIKEDLTPLNLPLIDTLSLSKALYGSKKYKSYSLYSLSKKFSLYISDQELHSAEYDANCLLRLWKIWEKELTELFLDPYVYSSLENLNYFYNRKDLLRNYNGDHLLLFSKNQEGMSDLYELISKAHIELFEGKPLIDWESIEGKRKNLIVISSSTESGVIEAVFMNNFQSFASKGAKYDYISLPPPSHFLHEINRGHYSIEQICFLLKKGYEWGRKCGFKMLANYCAKFFSYSEIEQYKVLVHAKNIGGKRHPLHSSKWSNDVLPDYSWRSSEKLISEFEFLGLNSEEKEELFFRYRDEIIAHISPDIQVIFRSLTLPKIEGASESMRLYIENKLKAKYGSKMDIYIRNTLEKEFNGIIENGYESVYWSAHLLVKKSKSEGFLVGSRGSVGSSFLAYILEISEVNPLPAHYFCTKCSHFELVHKYPESGFDLRKKSCPYCGVEMQSDGQNIPFETFMGLERKKVPDIDLNFSGQYQQKAHSYLREIFGEKNTFRAGTISAVAEKISFALSKNYLKDNNIEFNRGKLHWLSYRLTNVKRTTGQHPGGIIVIPEGESIYRYTPLNFPANDLTSEWLTTHFDKDAFKDSLFKFDVLGQDDPTILSLLSKFTGYDLEQIKYNDRKILSLFNSIRELNISGENLEILEESVGTIGLPEFGTEKTREILKACSSRICNFSDLIRISGISHGKNVWKNNIERLISEHRLNLSQVITCRDDIMNYLLEKNIELEKAFKITESVRSGKGIPNEYLPLLRASNVPEWYISCANKITYIFPKAHATAYVLMCWKIAFFKLYYPVEFYAAYFTITNKHFDIETLLTNDILLIKNKYRLGKIAMKTKKKDSNIEKTRYLVMIYEVAIEMIARGIKFKHINLNSSLASVFKPDASEKTILLPFSSITGLGEVTSTQLEEERERGGEYKNRADLESRLRLNINVLRLFEQMNIIEPMPKQDEQLRS